MNRVNSIVNKCEERQLKTKHVTLHVQEVKVSPTKDDYTLK